MAAMDQNIYRKDSRALLPPQQQVADGPMQNLPMAM